LPAQERRERLIGHESNDINNQAYRPEDRDKMFPIVMLLADLSKLEFGLTHPIYAAQPAHRSARFKAARGRKRRKAVRSAAMGAGADHGTARRACESLPPCD
jgi:hypothetical protein